MRTLFRLFHLRNPFKSRFRDSERGQVVIVLAAGFLLVILGASAMAVDVGNGLLQKRRLQNVADAASTAAASVRARGGTVTDAVAAAQSIVTSNTSGQVSLPYPGTGTGVNLQNGIEISGSDVRVALQRPVDTMFGGAVGLNTMNVVARSRANTHGSSTFLPIAVKRFSDGDTSRPLGSINNNPDSVVDYVARGDTADISSWPSPLTAPAPTSPVYNSTYAPSGVSAKTGQVVALLGSNAQPNVSGNSNFHFWVAPDFRDITTGPTYIPPASPSTSAQQWKDLESSYFYPLKGYTGDPLPAVGQQLATMNGVVTNMAVAAMRKSFNVGDIVSVLVYDGTVYDASGDFSLSVTPAVSGIGGSEVDYTVTVKANNTFGSSNVMFSAVGLEGWGDWKFEDQSNVNEAYTKTVSSGTTTLTFRVFPSGSPGNSKTALIIAHDTGSSNLTRTAMASAVPTGGADKTYSITSTQPYRVVEQDSPTSFNLTLRGQNGYNDNSVGIAGSVLWYHYDPTSGNPLGTGVTRTDVQVSVEGGSVKVQNNKDVKLTLNFDVNSAAATSGSWGDWIVRVPLKDGTAWLHVRIVPAGTLTNMSSTTSYVNVLGYAYFVISYHDGSFTNYSNPLDGGTIYGYAVTGLLNSPEDAPEYIGMKSRLVPWD